jgi:putative protease
VSALVYELNTSISNLRDLRASDLGPYDAVYLGNIYCRLYERNLLERPGDLREAIRMVRDQGKRPYLTTYAAPRNDFLPRVRQAVEVALAEQVEAVEVHNLGILKIVHDEFPGLAVHVGGFANVYTDAGAEVLKAFGAVRLAPNYELALDEIDQIAGSVGVPMEILVHGKMPLGISDYCFLLEYEEKWGMRCPDLCQQELFLKKEGWGMKSVGKGVLSGKDVCMLEHLPGLLAGGHRHFRIEATSERPAYRLDVGRVYREALARAGEAGFRVEDSWWETARSHARLGLCNGFYFGRSGMEYVGARPPAPLVATAPRESGQP